MLRISLAFGLVLFAAIAAIVAAEPVKSGLQPGEKITTIFESLNVTGEHAGEPYCLICENGLSPVAMLFARDVNEPLLKLLSKLDEATDKHRNQEMGSFVVFLNDDDGLPKRLAEAAKRRGLKRIVLSTFEPAGPERFKVTADADLTVVLYREHEVKANFAFRKGELTEADGDAVLAALPKILTK